MQIHDERGEGFAVVQNILVVINTGIVDQHINLPVLIVAIVVQFACSIGCTEVTHQTVCLYIILFAERGGAISNLIFVAHDNQRIAFLSQLTGKLKTDTAAGAGNQCKIIYLFLFHLSTFNLQLIMRCASA